MKAYTILMVFTLILTSCKDANPNAVEQTKTTETTTTEIVNKETPIKNKSKKQTIHLCKINGKDWAYTKASGVASRNKKTKKRTAIFTFTKKLEKGSESIQLTYDGDSNILESASVTLRLPKKGGGTTDAYYQLFPDTRKRHPESDLSGTIDLSNPTKASGNAELTKLKIRWEAEKLADSAYSVIDITDIKFSDIGYSDAERLFGAKNN